MNGDTSLNEILQAAGVAFALIVCILYIVRRVRRKNLDTDCSGCPLAEHCSPTHKKGCKKTPSGGCGCGCR
ncbi:MAG: hypothetical protein HDR77_02940 [Bacteroides sp.]|nr:hypothetical protein [Bacteroides sp.]